MNLSGLSELGLSKGSVKVYKALLEIGPTSLNWIQEKTGIERRNIYDILKKLTEKGLVTYIEENQKKVFQCTEPHNLLELIKKKRLRLKEAEKEVSSIKPLTHSDYIGATIYRGNESMKALLEEILTYKASYWIGGNSGIEKTNLRGWFKGWTERRIEKKKAMYDLVDHGSQLEDFPPEDHVKHKAAYYHYCSLPKSLTSPMVVIIFGDHVAQILWSEQSFAFVIKSRKIKNSFMKYFHYFWKKA